MTKREKEQKIDYNKKEIDRKVHKMTIEELYKIAEGDFNTVLGSFGSPALVEKFVKKFLLDDSYEQLAEKLKEKDVQESFRAAHTLKGICMNLGFDGLLVPVKEITEILRAGSMEKTDELMVTITDKYNTLCEAIKKL